jgi:hypothetical protein
MQQQVGLDTRSGPIHSASVTAANVHDSLEVANLLHGEEARFYGDRALRPAGDAQCQQMGTTSDGTGASGLNSKRGNPSLSGSKKGVYPMRLPFSNRFRLDLRSPTPFAVTSSAFP